MSTAPTTTRERVILVGPKVYRESELPEKYKWKLKQQEQIAKLRKMTPGQIWGV